MRIIGLDLGTKTCGVALTDKSGTISSFYKVIHFNNADYQDACKQVLDIIKEKEVGEIALGLPINMNSSLGGAAMRSMTFKEMLEEKVDIPITLIDERLSTIEAENLLVNADMSREKRKKIIDGVAATIILDTYLKRKENRSGLGN